MRRLFVALALTSLATAVSAGEFELPDAPVLRGSSPYVPGPPTFRRWEGFYVGGQVGGGSAHYDFRNASQSLVALMLRELALENEQHPSTWQVLGNSNSGGASAGGFIGYNTQWDNVVIGVDAHYSASTFSAAARPIPISRSTSAGGNAYVLTVDGTASMRITDWGSARLRAGWVLDNLMPYGTIGVAVGRANISRTANVVGIENPSAPPPCGAPPEANCTPFSFSESETKTGTWMWGWTVGIGFDYLIMPNVFLRAEYEYVYFAQVAGIKPTISNGRIGVGLKF